MNWLSISPTSGHGNTQITLSASTLTGLEDRIATLIATGSQEGQTLSATTVVTQKHLTLTEIYFENLTWSTDVAWGGGTADKNNCTYTIFAKYSDNSTEDITNLATVSGSLVVPATTATTRQSVGTLTLTATYEDKTCTGNVEVYQEAPLLSEIFFNNLTWINDITWSGGTATKDNCSYTIFAKYSNNVQANITSEAEVTGSLAVPVTTATTRQSVGNLELTATFGGKTCTGNVTAYQEAPSLSEIFFNNLKWVTDIPASGGTATKDNCTYSVKAYYSNNVQVDVTSEAEVTGSLVVENSIIEERHSAGTLMLTAEYENLTCNGSVTAYQEAYYRDYLKFTFVSDGTWIHGDSSSPSSKGVEYSINNGEWKHIRSIELSVLSGDTIRVRGTNNVYDENKFSGTAYFNLSGNIMALIGGVNYENLKELNYNRVFAQIFANSNVVEASELLLPATTLTEECYQSIFQGCTSLKTAPALPATTLANYCYQQMFLGCTSLTTAPELPANTLADYCYYNMFKGCTSLTTAPELPATTLKPNCYCYMFYNCTSLTTAPALPLTTLVDSCYEGMFEGCTSLTTAPALPATTLATSCYQYMFEGCKSLTTAPELPATTLAHSCYKGMFIGCTSLTKAPVLPATTLRDACYYAMFQGCTSLTAAPVLPATTLREWSYQQMFNGCTSLNYIKCLATDISENMCTWLWTKDVAATGTFVKNPNMTSWTEDAGGIPYGWTVVNNS